MSPVSLADPVYDAKGFTKDAHYRKQHSKMKKKHQVHILEQMRGMELIISQDPRTSTLRNFNNIEYSLERLEKTVATLLDRLGEGPSTHDDHESSRPASALTTPETGDSYRETEASAAPIMVIRDLAADTGVKSAPDTRSTEAVLDDLITPGLALTLVTMYALSR